MPAGIGRSRPAPPGSWAAIPDGPRGRPGRGHDSQHQTPAIATNQGGRESGPRLPAGDGSSRARDHRKGGTFRIDLTAEGSRPTRHRRNRRPTTPVAAIDERQHKPAAIPQKARCSAASDRQPLVIRSPAIAGSTPTVPSIADAQRRQERAEKQSRVRGSDARARPDTHGVPRTLAQTRQPNMNPAWRLAHSTKSGTSRASGPW